MTIYILLGVIFYLMGISFRFSPLLRFLLLQRFYAKNYEGIYARSFEEGGQVRNESGVYLGAEAVLGSGMKLMGYVDFFRFHT